MRRRCCHWCAGVFAVITIAIVDLGDCRPQNPHMDLWITIWKSWSLFPYGDLTQMDPLYHAEIPIWEQGLTYPHMERVNHRFHIGIENFWLPISIWGSPYGNGDWRVPVSIRGLSVTKRGFDANGSPLPYGDPDMGTGIDKSPYGKDYSPFPYGDWEVLAPRFHMGIAIWKRGLTRPYFHMGTIQSLTHFHKVFVTIWEFRKKSPYENN